MSFEIGDEVEWTIERGKKATIISAAFCPPDAFIISIDDIDEYNKPITRAYVAHTKDFIPWEDTIYGAPSTPEIQQAWERILEKHTKTDSGITQTKTKFQVGDRVTFEGRAGKIDFIHHGGPTIWGTELEHAYDVVFDIGGEALIKEARLTPLIIRGCECGARHTTFADHHMHYCPLAPKKADSDGK